MAGTCNEDVLALDAQAWRCEARPKRRNLDDRYFDGRKPEEEPSAYHGQLQGDEEGVGDVGVEGERVASEPVSEVVHACVRESKVFAVSYYSIVVSSFIVTWCWLGS